MTYKAIAFDTGGTVLDWHGGLVAALEGLAATRGIAADWHPVVNDWRRRTMQGIVGQRHPDFHMDDLHRRFLDEALAAAGPATSAFTQDDRDRLWRTWHALAAWPDFAPAVARLRPRFPIVSLTMLPLALVVDVSRRNGLAWDAIVSCQMTGIYKPHAQAYLTAARWLGLAPADILMVACHNFDLKAAGALGMGTAFVHRPDEWGPAGPPDPTPSGPYDLIVPDFGRLADRLLAG